MSDSLAILKWDTNKKCITYLEYGPDTNYGLTSSSTALSTSRSVYITNLLPGTVYHFRIIAQDYTGNVTVTGDYTFTTTSFEANEYAWLHVEGKYIRKSDKCKYPNGIWMGCGFAHRVQYQHWTENDITYHLPIAEWITGKNINVVRISISNLDRSAFPDIEGWVINTVAPLVDYYKQKKIYTIIDSHYYMGNSASSSSRSEATIWDVDNATATLCQRWLDDWAFIANFFKNEPWVAGYELCNEPVIETKNGRDGPALCRKNYKKCIELIRQVDTKHILFIGNNFWSNPINHKTCWEDGLPDNEKYNPDPQYRQVVFTFHTYPNFVDVYTTGSNSVNDEIGRIQNTYNVPLMYTEFGADGEISGVTEPEKRKFEQEIMEVCYGQPNFWQGVTEIPDPAYPSRGMLAGNNNTSTGIFPYK